MVNPFENNVLYDEEILLQLKKTYNYLMDIDINAYHLAKKISENNLDDVWIDIVFLNDKYLFKVDDIVKCIQ